VYPDFGGKSSADAIAFVNDNQFVVGRNKKRFFQLLTCDINTGESDLIDQANGYLSTLEVSPLSNSF